jgi:hypothetical protein
MIMPASSASMSVLASLRRSGCDVVIVRRLLGSSTA